jgi:glycosyltransferase involved in cell wall biosynthesis
MNGESNNPVVTPWDLLIEEKHYDHSDYPKVTVVIPTLNNASSITLTLDSVLAQDYPDLEIIVIDAGSLDRTIEMVKSYFDPRIRICTVTTYHRYDMLNKGISMSNGQYINFLFPGDYYIDYRTHKIMMALALNNDKPELVYGGSVLRDGVSEVKILYRPMSLSLLKKGLQPTSLQSCWFKADTLRELGKFHTDYHLRGGFDLMCRFALQDELRHFSTPRVLTDYDLRGFTRSMIMTHFWETMRVLNSYFGMATVLNWLWSQKDIGRLLKIWWRNVKSAFSGQKV